MQARLTSVSFHCEETTGCSKPQPVEILQRIGLLIVIRVLFAWLD